ncbi:MAG: DNA recombination protein RmuC [Cyclobacteriaceae bacterium]|jgi:DNA recombination protein RmuC|nr:DNA recombination protein RmuC [Cyclobacteriaceae bacterium]
MELIYLVVGVVLGSATAWLVARSKAIADRRQNETSLVVEQEKVKSLTEQLAEARQASEADRQKILDLNHALASLEADYRNLEEKLREQNQESLALHEKFTKEFENLANRIFDEKNRKFTEQNRTQLFDMLKPLGERIVEFEKKIDQTHRDAIEKNASLFNELKNLKDLNLQMSEEARNLTRALRGDTRTQGAWGEFILESILEKCGLERGREYTVQEAYVAANGRRQQPDVVVHLPDNRHIIIDSKVSLKSYDAYVNSESEEQRATSLKAHLQSIRQHMRLLADKSYQKNYSENGLDFVIMFIPLEPAYLLAIQTEPTLYEEAFDKRIVFVSPTLLLPSLQLIRSVWRQEYQNRHVLEIAKRAGDLYDKFVGFTDDLITLGRHLESSKRYYDDSMKKLSEGSGNLVSRVEQLKKLGARADKAIDSRLLSRAEDQPQLFD